MRRLTRVICSTAAVVAMTACGSKVTPTGPGSSPSEPSATSAGAASTPTGETQPGVFPVTITRIGGVAGFHDLLVVAGDGMVSVTRKAHERQQCRLTPEAIQRLTTATAQVPWPRITRATTNPSFPDDLVTMVRSSAGGPVRLEDPQVGAGGQFFRELLTDLGGGPASSRMCKPV
jgi:hypothetical protein